MIYLSKSNTIGGLFSCVGEPYSLFAMDAYPHLSTQYCLISEKEKLNSGGVALSLLDYTANHFFQMRIGMSNDLLLPLDEVISPLGHSDFLSPLSVLPLYLKMWEKWCNLKTIVQDVLSSNFLCLVQPQGLLAIFALHHHH